MLTPLAHLLRPLVRMLIRSGITFPVLADLLSELYVHVAEHDFSLPGKGQTDSRINILTGINRKEVSRLRSSGTPVHVVPAVLSLTSQVLAHWLASPDYTDEAGRPLPLPRTAAEGQPSFERLVEAVTRDVRPRAIADEWLNQGLIARDAQDRFQLTATALVPSAGSDDQLYYFGRNLHDHIAAAAANVAGDGPRFLERAVHYDGLSETIAEQLENRAKTLANDALQVANRDAHGVAGDVVSGDWRWIFGVYVYRARMTSEFGTPDSKEPSG